jgi:hypothetical protein
MGGGDPAAHDGTLTVDDVAVGVSRVMMFVAPRRVRDEAPVIIKGVVASVGGVGPPERLGSPYSRWPWRGGAEESQWEAREVAELVWPLGHV